MANATDELRRRPDAPAYGGRRPNRLEEVAHAFDIRGIAFEPDRLVQIGSRREMRHGIRRERPYRGGERLAIEDVADVVRGHDCGLWWRVAFVEPADFVTRSGERLHESPSDEPRAAGYENAHAEQRGGPLTGRGRR